MGCAQGSSGGFVGHRAAFTSWLGIYLGLGNCVCDWLPWHTC